MGSFTPPPTTALSPGDRLDRYELLCVLAQGGMGTVWLARMTGKHGFERLVALKTILPTYGNDRQFCDMFLDEARIAAQVDHENVARILEIGEDRKVLYHAMELVDGESLRKLYRDVRAVGAAFPLPVALRIAADTCAGLHAVHELKDGQGVSLDVVHRDVSPQNILINIRGTIKLIDFGVAKARERRTEDTTAGTLKGKLEYMAPEQARGESMDRRADIYAIGAVLYELLMGSPVRNTEDGRQLLALHELMTGAPYEPVRSSVPLPVRSIVDRALARDPNERYLTAEDLRRALEQAMLSLNIHANSDDVANVLAQFSRERTAKRKEAIEAAVRAAPRPDQALGPGKTTALPLPPASTGRSAGGSSSYPLHDLMETPGGTRVIGVHPFAGPTTSSASVPAVAPLPAPPVSHAPINPFEGPGTGPSMRTMQGASFSEPPPPSAQPSGTGRVIGMVVVLGFVAVLGVVVGVLVTRNTGTGSVAHAGPPDPTGSIAAALPEPPSPALAPPVVPTLPEGTTTPPSANVANGSTGTNGTNGTNGTILGASDGGAAATGANAAGSARAAPRRPPPPSAPARPAPRPGQKPDDEYGF